MHSAKLTYSAKRFKLLTVYLSVSQCTKHYCSLYGWLRNLKDGLSIQRLPIRPSNDKFQSLDVVRAKSIQNRVITPVQKQILLSSDKIDENMLQACAKKKQHNDFVTRLLVACKTWRGPCTSKEELLAVIQKHPDLTKQIVATELAYYVHTHPDERAFHPELFRQVKLSIDEKIENLCLLLSANETSSAVSTSHQVLIPTNEDALAILTNQPVPISLYEANELCVTLWWEGDAVVWYLGYYKSIVASTKYKVEHLVRKDQENNVFWVHSERPSDDEVDEEQILKKANGTRLIVSGQWDFSRTNTFCLKNIQEVEFLFNQAKNTF